MTVAAPPDVAVHFVASDAPRGWLDAPRLTASAPALCNALFAAGGKRVRTLPIRRALDEGD